MIRRLVARSFLQSPGRSALLLAGYALGVGVTVALLSIGAALLEQSRDRTLVGGGDLVVLPAGLDVETFRTGGVSSLYASVERAPFLYREVLSGRRFAGRIAAAAPWIENELVYLELGDSIRAASAAGQIPGLARTLGAGPELEHGRWQDLPADERWTSPGDSALYAGIDAFHLPAGEAAGDSTWAEWHYFNVLLPDDEGWLYLTYMVAGAVPDGRWGGRLLATLVTRRDGREDAGHEVRSIEREVGPEAVAFSLERPDVRIGGSTVTLDSAGSYRLRAEPSAAPPLEVDLTVSAPRPRYLPPLEAAPGAFVSGYVVPMLDGRAAGRICLGARCWLPEGTSAYHDHNWGVWRNVTWDWGQARAGSYTLLYGGVDRGPSAPAGGAADAGDDGLRTTSGGRFAFLTDSLGFAGMLTLDSLAHRWRGEGAERRPAGIRLRAAGAGGTVVGEVDVTHARWSAGSADAADAPEADAVRRFWQMRGTVRLRGTLLGDSLAATGEGFFETWTPPRPDGPARGGG